MVHFVRLLTAAALVSVSAAAPMKARDNSYGGGSGYGGDSSSSDSSYSAPSDNSGSYNSDSSYSAPPSQYTSSSYDNSYSAPPSQYTSSSYDNSYQSSSYDNSNTNSYDNSYSSSSYDNSNTNSYDNSYSSSSVDTNTYDNSYSTSSSYDNSYSSSSVDTNSYDNSYSTSTYDNSYNSYTTTSDYQSTTTTTSEYSYSTASYGSGNSNWGSGYNDCVMQCAASFGMPSGTWAPPTETSTDSSMYGGESGSNGVTHTIIVAPTQGVFRYVPFSTNASVGDTVAFQWNAGPHTVTSSSALELCTKNSQGPLSSGQQNQGFTYDFVVKDDKPTWFYCGVGTHCKQGMFGGININQPNPDGSDYVPLSSVAQNMTQGNSDMANMWHYAKQQTGSNVYANNWGMSINVGGMDSDSMGEVMKNVLYTQTVIAANPDAVDSTKGFQVGSKPLKMPGDISTLLANAPSGSNSSAPAASSGSPASSSSGTAAPASTSASGKNGATSMISSSAAVAFVAVAASFLML